MKTVTTIDIRPNVLDRSLEQPAGSASCSNGRSAHPTEFLLRESYGQKIFNNISKIINKNNYFEYYVQNILKKKYYW